MPRLAVVGDQLLGHRRRDSQVPDFPRRAERGRRPLCRGDGVAVGRVPARASSTFPSPRAIDSTRTAIASPRRKARPERRPRSAVAVAFELEELPGQPPRRQKALEDLAEAHEEPRADQPGDLALPGLAPSRARAARLRAARRGRCRPRGTRARPPRARAAEAWTASSSRSSAWRITGEPELGKQRPVDDEVGVAADRRGEVAVGGARETGVAEVARVVARLLERAQDERRERLPPTPRRARRSRSTSRETARGEPPPPAAG